MKRETGKTLCISVAGRPSFKNLDPIEVFLLDKALEGKPALPLVVIQAIAEALHLSILVVDDLSDEDSRCLNPHGFMDLRYGSGRFEKTPDLESGPTAHFIRKKGDMEGADLQRWQEAGKVPFYYELDPLGLSLKERGLLGALLPLGPFRYGDCQSEESFKVHVAATAELARRLGLRPEFGQEIVS